MGIFENFKEIDCQIVNDGWVQILDNKSNWTIEDFPYDKGVDENITKPHNDNMGFRISMILNFPGMNEKSLNNYKIKTGWTIFPNKQLKCNTIIGGLKK